MHCSVIATRSLMALLGAALLGSLWMPASPVADDASSASVIVIRGSASPVLM